MVVGEEQDSNIREPPTLWDLINDTELLGFSIDEKKPYLSIRFFLMVVGEEGFEPPTLWSQTRC
ncbi:MULTISPECIES: hypothetical protein, partial [unclassified Photobacterium]|uniref:hypothetical protein n=1 Tax=unclassified Photobacterium TaxID=2628852 RepID=UPI001EDFF391